MQGYVRAGSSQPVWLFPFIVSVVLFLSVLPLARLAVVGISAFANGGVMVVLSDPMVWSAVYYTIVTAVLGTVISLIIGCAFAYLLTLTDIPAKGPLSFFFVLPMMIPPQVTALAWVQMSGPSSPLLKALHIAPPMGSPQPLYSVGGIALLYGVQHAPLVYLALRAGLMTLPRDGVEAARLSGAGFFRRLKDIIVPLIAPAAGASVILVFLIACNELTISALLWSAGTQTLGVAIYNLDDSGSSDLASALSVLVVFMVVAMMLLLELLAKHLPKGVVPWRS